MDADDRVRLDVGVYVEVARFGARAAVQPEEAAFAAASRPA